MKLLTVLLLALAAQAGDEIVARIGPVAIPRSAVLRRQADFQAQNDALDLDRALATLVDEALLAAEGERLKLRADPVVAERLEAERRRLAADALVEVEAAASGGIPEATLRDMFHASSDFLRYELIVYDSEPAAKAGRERIAKGGTFVAEAPKAIVATVYPSDAAAPYVLRAQVDPALARAAFEAKPGAVIGPIALATGFGVARVIEQQIGPEADFVAKRASLVEHATKRMAVQSRLHLAQQLKAKAAIAVDEPFLRGLVPGAQPTPAELDHVVATVNGKPLRYRDFEDDVRRVAGSGRGHLSGPSVKIQFAWKAIDQRLVEDFAIARGMASRPDVAARLEVASRNILAHAVADRLRAAGGEPALVARVEQLRKEFAPSIDGAALHKAGPGNR